MPDITVDSLLLEIEAPADNAKDGLKKISNALSSLKNATQSISTDKLEAIRDFANSITISKDTGDGMKGLAAGIRSIVKSVNNLNQVDTAKLHDITDSISKIGSSLGQLGSNNKINIRIDSEGIKKAVQPLQEVKDSVGKNVTEPYSDFLAKIQNVGKDFSFTGTGVALAKEIEKAESRLDSLLAKEEKMKLLGKADENSSSFRALQLDITETCNKLDTLYAKQEQEALEAERTAAGIDQLSAAMGEAAVKQEELNSSMNDKNGTDAASTRIQKLIEQINNFKKTISGMESGKELFNVEQYQNAVNGLAQAQMQFKIFKESIEDAPATVEDVAGSIRDIGNAASRCGLDTFSSILRNVATLLPQLNMGAIQASAGFQAMAAGLEAIQTAIPVIGIILTLITALVNSIRTTAGQVKSGIEAAVNAVKSGVNVMRTAFENLKMWVSSAFDKIKSAASSLATSIKSKFSAMGNSIKSTLSKAFSEVKSHLKLSDKSFTNFFDKLNSKLQKVLRLFTFMGLRKIMTAIYKEIGEMTEILAKFSDSIGSSFNTNMSGLIADFKWLAGSLVAAFEPILNIVLPIIDALVSRLVAAINVINQFFSVLGGALKWTKATKNVENYAKSLDKTGSSAKKAKNEVEKLTVASFDELHVLNDNKDNSSSGGGGINPADYFQTADIDQKVKDFLDRLKDMWKKADFTELGKELGDKLAKALASIPWAKIKAVARKLGKSIATFINGFIQGEFDGKSVSWWIGHTLAEAINTAFEFVNAFAKALDWKGLGKAIADFGHGLLDGIDWKLVFSTLKLLAKGVADFLNAITEDLDLWDKIGKTIANGLNAIITTIQTFVDAFDFGQAGKAIGTALGSALTNIHWKDLFVTISKSIEGFFDLLQGFTDTLPWTEIAIKITDGINEGLRIINLKWEKIQKSATSFFSNLGKSIKTALDNIKWDDLGKALANGIYTVLSGINAFLDSGVFESLGKSLNALIKSTLTTKIDKKTLGTAFGETLAKAVNAGFEYMFQLLNGLGATLAKTLTDFIKGALESLDWPLIQSTIMSIGKEIADFLNTIFQDTKLWSDIGATFRNILNSIIEGARTFVETFDFTSFGTAVATGLGDAISGIHWESIFTTLAELLNGVFESLKEFADKFPWEDIAHRFAHGLNNGLKKIDWTAIKDGFDSFCEGLGKNLNTMLNDIDWDGLGNTLGELINTLFSGLGKFLEQIDFETLGSNIAGAINTACDSIDWDTAGGTINTLINGISNLVNKMIDEIDWENLMTKITGLIANLDWDKLLEAAFRAIGKAWTFKNMFKTVSFASIADELVVGFTEGISKAFSDFESMAWDMSIGKFIKWIESELGIGGTAYNDVKDTGINVVNGFIEGITKAWLPAPMGAFACFFDFISGIKDAFKTHSPSQVFSDIGSDVIAGFQKGIDTYTTIKDNITKWAGDVVEWFTKGKDGKGIVENFTTLANEIIKGFGGEVSTKSTDSKSPMETWGKNTLEWFKGQASSEKFKEVAKGVIDGFKNGIGEFYESCRDSIERWGGKIITWFKDKLDSNSPSKVFYKIGSDTVEGYNDAIEQVGRTTSTVVSEWADSFTNEDFSNKFHIDTSELDNLEANYGDSFKDSSIIHSVKRELATSGNITATFNDQIITGIERGVYNAVTSALVNTDRDKYALVDVSLDGIKFARAMTKMQRKEQTRYSPTTV